MYPQFVNDERQTDRQTDRRTRRWTHLQTMRRQKAGRAGWRLGWWRDKHDVLCLSMMDDVLPSSI